MKAKLAIYTIIALWTAALAQDLTQEFRKLGIVQPQYYSTAVHPVAYPVDSYSTPKPTLVDKALEDGKLVLTFRRETPQNVVLLSNPPQYPGPVVEVWREIYVADGNQIALARVVKASYSPAKTTTVPEQLVWPE